MILIKELLEFGLLTSDGWMDGEMIMDDDIIAHVVGSGDCRSLGKAFHYIYYLCYDSCYSGNSLEWGDKGWSPSQSQPMRALDFF